jgi:hypothetical protein
MMLPPLTCQHFAVFFTLGFKNKPLHTLVASLQFVVPTPEEDWFSASARTEAMGCSCAMI